MIIEDTVEFLREVPPLCLLDPERLRALAGRACLEFHPAGTVVLGPGGAGEGFVHAVRKGALVSGGVVYGPGSVLGWTAGQATAEEDSVCVLLPPEAVGGALRHRAELFDFLEERLGAASLELGLDDLVRELPAGFSRRPLARVTAGEAARGGEPLAFGTTIREAARIMTETARDAALVLGPGGRPSGVVTDRDFRVKAVQPGLSPDTPVGAIMSAPLVSVDASATCFEALMAMTRHHLRHVVVMAGAVPAGVLSAQELLLRQVGSPPALAARVAGASSVEDLASVVALLDRLALDLLREGARVGDLARAVGGLRETLAARLCVLAEEALGPPPGGYALMLLGPAARREGPARLPLWSGLVHRDEPGAGAWCARLGEFLAGAFSRLGLGTGPGEPSAGDPEWRGSLADWKVRLSARISQDGWNGPDGPGLSSPDHLDFRPVHGLLGLAEELRTHLSGLVRALPPDGLAAGLAPWRSEASDGGTDRSSSASSGSRARGVPACSGEMSPGNDGRAEPVGATARRALALARELTDLARGGCLRLGVSRISTLERARALSAMLDLGPEPVHALEYLLAWRWAGSPSAGSPLAQAMERMCRRAAGRMRHGLVAFFGS